MKTILTVIAILTGLSLQAQTNVFHSLNPINKPGTNGVPFQFVFQSQAEMTNHEKGGLFTNSVPGGVMSFSCDPSNTTVCYVLQGPSEIVVGAGTNSFQWTNQPGDVWYLLGFACNQKLPAKPVAGTTTGLKP